MVRPVSSGASRFLDATVSDNSFGFRPMTDEQPILILGTGNRKKGIELAEQFGPLGLSLKTLADCESPIEVVEDGETFAENATLKATQQAKHLGTWVLGEDSGLQVDALKGAPGIYSARFSGSEATDASNNELLLEKLDGVVLEKTVSEVRLPYVAVGSRGSRSGGDGGLLSGENRF